MFDINNFTSIYRRTLRELGVTGSLVRLSLNPVKSKNLRILTHVTIENQTSPFTKARLGVSNRGVNYFLDEIQNISADELCVSRSDILLGDGDCFFAELTGTVTGDILVLNCSGWEQSL